MKNKAEIQFRLLQIATVCVFAGRAYQHLFWDAPYRELLWDPMFMQTLVDWLTPFTWDEYVTHPKGDIWIQKFVLLQGYFYLVCMLVALFIRKLPEWCLWILALGAVDLIFLALIYMKDKFYHFGQFFEYSLQFGAPLFLVYFLSKNRFSVRMLRVVVTATSLTFACHGLYAIGFYPRPGTFMTMVYNILGLDSQGIDWFLDAAGILDFIFAAGIFFVKGRLREALLIYAVLWGGATALARICGNFYWDFPLESLHQWVFESVFRFPHFLIPLFLLVSFRVQDQTTSTGSGV